MNKNLLVSVLLFVCITGKVSAQFSMSGEIRPRTELRSGFKTLTNKDNQPAFFTEQRSRLYMDYKAEKFAVRLSFQDVRIWGETPQIFKSENGNTFISEAWGEYFFAEKFSVRVGRQILSYDNERFIGGLEWAQQGRRHDAVVFLYENGESKTRFHLGTAFNQDDGPAEPAKLQGPAGTLYEVPGNYKTMQYAWFHKDFASGGLSLVGLNDGFQNLADSSLSFRQTIGFVGSNKFGGLTVGADFYYQMGKSGDADISAYLGGAYVTVKTPITPLTLGVELVSGKDADDTLSTDIRHFDPAYGTNHAHNGYMDYFYVGPQNGNVGVTDFYLKTKFSLAGGDLNIHLHEFLTGSVQYDATDVKLSAPMGTEVDLVYVKKLGEVITWHLGYSQMFASDTMEAIRGGDRSAMQFWAWTMLTFKPKFL